MAEIDSRVRPRQHLYALRKHVLGPLSTAEGIAKHERTEVARERDAFDEFATRVERIEPVSVPTPALQRGIEPAESTSERTEELRQAYRETVLSVSHYDEVYGESLSENVTAEFGPSVAVLFEPANGISFTAQHKALLTSAVDQQRRDRDEFCDLLDREIESLRTMRRDLTTVLGTLDNSIVPAWYRNEFEERVGDIHSVRQSTLYGRSLPASYDGHTLCAYLYDEEQWTYPGLTAVARLLGSVVLRET